MPPKQIIGGAPRSTAKCPVTPCTRSSSPGKWIWSPSIGGKWHPRDTWSYGLIADQPPPFVSLRALRGEIRLVPVRRRGQHPSATEARVPQLSPPWAHRCDSQIMTGAPEGSMARHIRCPFQLWFIVISWWMRPPAPSICETLRSNWSVLFMGCFLVVDADCVNGCLILRNVNPLLWRDKLSKAVP